MASATSTDGWALFGARNRQAAAFDAAPCEAGASCKYLQRRQNLRLRTRRSGFSLIEVVIAIGVFLFGALAIVRIFPGAIAVIQTSEQRNVAQRMNQTSLAQYTNAPLSVPEAITDVNPANYNATNETGWSDFPGSVFGTGTINESLPREPASPDDISPDNSQPISTQLTRSAAGRFRRIIGEEHVVEQEGSGTTARGVITLRYPFVVPASASASVHSPRLYQYIPVNGVTIGTTGILNFTDATAVFAGTVASMSDSSGANRAYRPRESTPETPPVSLRIGASGSQQATFYVSYRYIQGGATFGVTDEPRRFPITGSWTDGSTTESQVLVERLDSSNVVTPIAGPVSVKIRRPVTPPTTTAVDSSLGRMFVPASLVGQRISVDYSVPDWRMIVHDDNLSTTISSFSTGTGSTDQEYLKDVGYTFGTGTTDVKTPRVTTVPTRFIAEDPLSQATPVASTPSQVYTLLKGTSTGGVNAFTGEWSPDPGKFTTPSQTSPTFTGTASVLGVRPKTGQVFFDTSGLTSPSSRVVYRNVDGWLEQPSVAARSYVPHLARPATNPEYWPSEPWREYVLNTDDDALYFHPSETGKTVLATYRYQVGTATPILMQDVPVTVREEPVTQPTGAVFAGFSSAPNTANLVARAYLVDNSGRCIGSAAAGDTNVTSVVGPKIVAILGIKGASIRVRSAWFAGGRYSQNDVSTYRSLDVESANRS